MGTEVEGGETGGVFDGVYKDRGSGMGKQGEICGLAAVTLTKVETSDMWGGQQHLGDLRGNVVTNGISRYSLQQKRWFTQIQCR